MIYLLRWEGFGQFIRPLSRAVLCGCTKLENSSSIPSPEFMSMATNGSETQVNLTELLSKEEQEELKEGLLSGYSSEVSIFPLYLRLWATLASTLIFVIGMGGNALVPLLMWRNRQLRHSTNIFLLNLALADFLVLLICLPTAMVELHTSPNAWILGEVMCRLVPFIEVSVVRASVFTLTVISVERYIAICKPLRASTLCTRPRALGVCLGIWPVSFIVAGPVLIATEFREPNPETQSTHSTCMTPLRQPWVSGYFLGSAIAFFLVPLIFLSSIYLFIGKKLLNHRARSNKKLDNSHWNARKQVAGMLGAVVIIFFVCLLPFQCLIMWLVVSPAEDIGELGPHVYFNILFVCRVLVYINAAANPIVYNAMSAKFRHAFFRLIGIKLVRPIYGVRRRSTLTTIFSSSSNASASSRSNSFRRIANLALKRSFSDASIRKTDATGPRLSSQTVFPSPKGSPSMPRARKGFLEKWYLRKGTSGSYFSGDSNYNVFSEDALLPLSRPLHAIQSQAKAKYSPLLGKLQNGYLQERNRSLPELFTPSLPAKRVSFKDNALPLERPQIVISPLAYNSHEVEGEIEPPKNIKKFRLENKGRKKMRGRETKSLYRQILNFSQKTREDETSRDWDTRERNLGSPLVELKEMNKKMKERRISDGEEKEDDKKAEKEGETVASKSPKSKFIFEGNKSSWFRKI